MKLSYVTPTSWIYPNFPFCTNSILLLVVIIFPFIHFNSHPFNARIICIDNMKSAPTLFYYTENSQRLSKPDHLISQTVKTFKHYVVYRPFHKIVYFYWSPTSLFVTILILFHSLQDTLLLIIIIMINVYCICEKIAYYL
jgi:hypothetical protein